MDSLALAGPSKLVAFFAFANGGVAQIFLQFFKVNGGLDIAIFVNSLGDAFREKVPDFFDVLVHHIKAVHVRFFHFGTP